MGKIYYAEFQRDTTSISQIIDIILAIYIVIFSFSELIHTVLWW